MSTQPQKRQNPGLIPTGFTLIELLIVVAIIAILAAIAVPNFLEAQVRSKISRAKADLRTIAVAMESYYVDNNSYTRANTEEEHPAQPGFDYVGYKQLLQPISYLSSIPQDGFGPSNAGTGGTRYRQPTYGLGTGKAATHRSTRTDGWPADTYLCDSDGPDKLDNTQAALANGQYPWGGTNPNLTPNSMNYRGTQNGINCAVLTLPYDPTNGTVSEGEVMRFGGARPNGLIYDYLWQSSVQ